MVTLAANGDGTPLSPESGSLSTHTTLAGIFRVIEMSPLPVEGNLATTQVHHIELGVGYRAIKLLPFY
jgi:hypothetical protein